MSHFAERTQPANGHVVFNYVQPDGTLVWPGRYWPNQRQYAWGHIVAQALRGRPEYKLWGMYLEFENVPDPEDPITPPAYGREDGVEYYNNLAGHDSRDYLRVPFDQEPSLAVAPGFEDFLAANQGNRIIMTTQTAGLVGVHGKEFSSAVNSKLFGVAIIAAPGGTADPTQDLIFVRAYSPQEAQAVKTPTLQISAKWHATFE